MQPSANFLKDKFEDCIEHFTTSGQCYARKLSALTCPWYIMKQRRPQHQTSSEKNISFVAKHLAFVLQENPPMFSN